MATLLTPVDSDLPTTVYIWIQAVNEKWLPRIMVSNSYKDIYTKDNFWLSIADRPEIVVGKCKFKPDELEVVKNWIILNKNLLIDYWNEEETSTLRLLNKLQNL